MTSLIYYLVLLVFTILYFVLLIIVFCLTVWFDKERVIVHYASRLWSMSIFRLCPFWKIKVEGKEKIDRSKAWMVITNHQSMLDIPLMYVLPLTFKWVSKAEVKKWPIFGQVLYLHGDILIERGSGSSARKMMVKCKDHLDKGTSVIIFPEGTRTKTGRIGRFKEGAFVAAKNAGVGILPVVAEGTGSLMKGWKLDMPHTFTVRILDLVSAEEVASSDLKELTAKMNQRMVTEHKTMVDEKIYKE